MFLIERWFGKRARSMQDDDGPTLARIHNSTHEGYDIRGTTTGRIRTVHATFAERWHGESYDAGVEELAERCVGALRLEGDDADDVRNWPLLNLPEQLNALVNKVDRLDLIDLSVVTDLAHVLRTQAPAVAAFYSPKLESLGVRLGDLIRSRRPEVDGPPTRAD